ncbi:MAG: tRNA (adenosine(37)-N6)-dimethylallyltransferase MiaA [Acidobacteriota bacterium]|nr:tRNA (adenosine(37)-N6)-dimethylallyltransferase MiaA [Acidobacteriota bacterium]
MTQPSAATHRPILAVVGPTASGKSDLGIAIALRFDGEIINCDSVQIYRRLLVGTSKVPPEQQAGVPHHLIDIVEPTEHFTAGQYARLATEVIQEIEARGKLAILVGGTGFYLRATRLPLFDSPPTDLRLRQRLTAILKRHGPAHMHRLLHRIDRASAQQIPINDWARTIRALEFYLQTGESIVDHLNRRPPAPEFARRLRVIALNPPRAELYQRINARAMRMFEQGWVEEVKTLLAAGVPASAKALGAHGYRRIVQYLHGELSLEQAIELTQQDVRHYAKRQLTWFRREPDVTWFDGFGDDPAVQRRVIDYLCGLFTRPA